MSTPRPRIEGETDESYKAMMVELGKQNEKMYGKKKTGQPLKPPTRAPAKGKGPMSPKPAPTRATSTFNPRDLISMAQSKKGIGSTGQPLGEEGFGPAGSTPKSGMSQGVGLMPAPTKGPMSPKPAPTRAPNPAAERIKAARQRIENVMSPKPAPTNGKVITDPMKLPPPTQPDKPMYVATPLVKKAAGGAAKVRKGMATPEGKILHAMNKVRGK